MPDALTTPALQARYAAMVIREYGEYLRLSDPDTYRFYVERAAFQFPESDPMLDANHHDRRLARRKRNLWFRFWFWRAERALRRGRTITAPKGYADQHYGPMAKPWFRFWCWRADRALRRGRTTSL